MNPWLESWIEALVCMLLIGIACLLFGCVSYGPSDWRPDQHVTIMRQCRVSCHPGRMAVYDAMDGSCRCAVRREK